MYSDVHAGTPDCEPPMIYSLAMPEGSTTEESNSPSEMSHEVRMQLGI